MTDAELIRRCVRGQEKAWGAFVKRFSPVVFWSVKRRLKRLGVEFCDSDVEDIHQQVFIYIWRHGKLSDLKDSEKAAAWLSVVSSSRAVKYIEGKSYQHRQNIVSLNEDIGEKEDLELQDVINAKEPQAQEVLHNRETAQLVHEALESLHHRDKMVLSLHYVCGYTLKEVAHYLGMPQGTVSSIINRCKEAVRKYLKDRDVEI